MNLRPPQPHCGALPGCATPRPKACLEGGNDTCRGENCNAWRPLRELAAQDLQNLFEFDPDLLDDLLALADVGLGLVTGKPLPGPADRESLVIQERANLANDQHVLALVIATVAAPLDGLELRELLLPVTEYVRLDQA